jgi:hypothetical protein
MSSADGVADTFHQNAGQEVQLRIYLIATISYLDKGVKREARIALDSNSENDDLNTLVDRSLRNQPWANDAYEISIRRSCCSVNDQGLIEEKYTTDTLFPRILIGERYSYERAKQKESELLRAALERIYLIRIQLGLSLGQECNQDKPDASVPQDKVLPADSVLAMADKILEVTANSKLKEGFDDDIMNAVDRYNRATRTILNSPNDSHFVRDVRGNYHIVEKYEQVTVIPFVSRRKDPFDIGFEIC